MSWKPGKTFKNVKVCNCNPLVKLLRNLQTNTWKANFVGTYSVSRNQQRAKKIQKKFIQKIVAKFFFHTSLTFLDELENPIWWTQKIVIQAAIKVYIICNKKLCCDLSPNTTVPSFMILTIRFLTVMSCK